MLVPEIVCLVPASRPGHVEHVLRNFERQTYERKTLLVVENGAAIGAYEETPGVTVICCDDAHHSSAKNVGLEYLRATAPHVFCCIMDDDDHYAPGYLEEYAANAEPGTILGKAPGWVMTDEGLRFFHRKNEARAAVNGGTMGFFVSDLPGLLFERRVAEEHGFVAAATTLGCGLKLLSQKHFCYERRGADHAYKTPSAGLFRCYGDAGILVPDIQGEDVGILDGVLEGPVQRPRDVRRVAA